MAKEKSNFKKMFASAFLGPLQVRNRLVMAPMGTRGTRMSSEVGGVSQWMIDYYAERAKGGVGTILTDAAVVDYPLGATGATNLNLHDNAYLGGHKELVEAVHAYGARPEAALYHKLAGKVPELHLIGDSDHVGKIGDATYEGFRVAPLI